MIFFMYEKKYIALKLEQWYSCSRTQFALKCSRNEVKFAIRNKDDTINCGSNLLSYSMYLPVQTIHSTAQCSEI